MIKEALEQASVINEALCKEGSFSTDILSFYMPFAVKNSWLHEYSEELKKYIIPGMKTLELGSGCSANMSLLFSLLGASLVCGIEARPTAVMQTKEYYRRLEQEHIIGSNSYRFAWGNYFPRGFRVPHSVKWEDWREGPSLLRRTDPYKDLGLQISDFDAFGVYQTTYNAYDTLRLLAERGRRGAYVVSIYDHPFNKALSSRMQLVSKTIFDKSYAPTMNIYKLTA